MSTIGDPLLDLGWLLATWPNDEWCPLPGAVCAAGGLPRPDELVTRYAEQGDRDASRADWYQVLACLKLAVVLEGTHARACAGKAPRSVGETLHATRCSSSTVPAPSSTTARSCERRAPRLVALSFAIGDLPCYAGSGIPFDDWSLCQPAHRSRRRAALAARPRHRRGERDLTTSAAARPVGTTHEVHAKARVARRRNAAVNACGTRERARRPRWCSSPALRSRALRWCIAPGHRSAFRGFGQPILPIGPNGTCPNGGRARTTQDDAQTMTVTSDNKSVFVGTAPTALCQNAASFDSLIEGAGFNRIPPLRRA